MVLWKQYYFMYELLHVISSVTALMLFLSRKVADEQCSDPRYIKLTSSYSESVL